MPFGTSITTATSMFQSAPGREAGRCQVRKP